VVVKTPLEERMIGGGETRKGIFVVVVWSVRVVVEVVVEVHFCVFVDVMVTFVVVGPMIDEQA
jgi:hypothetical protein